MGFVFFILLYFLCFFLLCYLLCYLFFSYLFFRFLLCFFFFRYLFFRFFLFLGYLYIQLLLLLWLRFRFRGLLLYETLHAHIGSVLGRIAQIIVYQSRHIRHGYNTHITDKLHCTLRCLQNMQSNTQFLTDNVDCT